MQEKNQGLLATRAKLETALNEAHRSKSLLDATIKSTASGVVVSDLDVNFLLINPAGRTLLGKLAELGPEHWNQSLGLFESEEGRLYDEYELPLARACRGETVKRMELLIRNGVSNQPIWLEANATQILDLNDQPIGAVTVFNDVTNERRSREGLRNLQVQTASKLMDSNRQLKEVLDTIHEVIWRGIQTEAGFRFIYFSPGIERVTGFKPKELTDRLNFWDDHLHSGDCQRVKTQISKIASGEIDNIEVEYRLIHSDGSICWIQNRIRSVTNDDTRIVQGIMSDITGERGAKLALARAEKLASIGTLAAGIAHEINNPLGAMLLTTELGRKRLANGTLSEEQTGTVLDDITKQIERCSQIVKSVLKFASNETTSRKIGSLNSIARESKLLIQFKAAKRKIEIVIHESKSIQPLASINETEIGQVIVNLLANAIDASPDRSQIDIYIRTKNDRVILSVADKGSGMGPDAEMTAFDPFYTTKRESGGNGLGLSMSHRIIENHKGKIWIEETTPNQGTTFSFWLPLAADRPDGMDKIGLGT